MASASLSSLAADTISGMATKEEFLVALLTVVETKARYGLDWFDEQWQSAQTALFI